MFDEKYNFKYETSTNLLNIWERYIIGYIIK